MIDKVGSYMNGNLVISAIVGLTTLVALLASPRTGNVTGSSFVIDGGMVKTT